MQTYLYIADSSNLHGNEPMSFFFTGNHFLVYSTPKQTRKLPVFRLPMMPCVRLFPLSPPFSVLYLRSALLVLVKFFSTPFYCLEQNKKKRKFHWAVWRLSSQRVLKAQLATRKRSENIDFMPLAGINLTPPTCTSRSVYRAYIYDFIRQSNSSF